MKSTRNPTAEDYLIRSWYDNVTDDRENQWPGVTTLIYCLTKAYYQRKFLPQRPNRRTSMMFATGLWLEEVILGPTQNATAGEVNGIFFHTDHMDYEDGPHLTEVKSTRKSMKKGKKPNRVEVTFNDLNPAWKRQFLAYCKAEGTLKGRAVILHLMGDYSPPFPDLRVWDIETTQEEVDANWAWMLGRKYILDNAIKDSIPPEPYQFRVVDWDPDANPSDDYECNECPFASLCENRSRGLV